MASGRVPKMGMMLGTIFPQKSGFAADRDMYILSEGAAEPETEQIRSSRP